jgi:hypothetical protein
MKLIHTFYTRQSKVCVYRLPNGGTKRVVYPR